MGAPWTLRRWATARADAIENMAAHLKAAATALSLDYKPAAKIVPAMDLGLFLPNPDHDQINTLLQNAIPNATAGGFDGSAASFLPYLENVEPPNEVDNFPLSYEIIQIYSELLQAAQSSSDTSKDNFDPVVACANPKLRLPASVNKLDDDASSPSDVNLPRYNPPPK